MSQPIRLTRRLAGLLAARLPEIGLEEVKDPRADRGQRWRLSALLRAPLVALCAGAKSLYETEALTAEMAPSMRRLLGIRRRVPDTTLRHTLLRVDPRHLRAGLYRQVKAAHRRKALTPMALPFGVCAIDGKATSIAAWDDVVSQRQRHSNGEGASGIVRTLTACLVSAAAKPCLDACPVPPSTNEMGAFETALAALCAAYGRLNLFQLVSVDAGMASLKNAEAIRRRGLHYLFGLKADQPTLLAEATRLLAHRPAEHAVCETEDVLSNNKVVTRRLFLSQEMAGFLAWEHLNTVLRVQSETRELLRDERGRMIGDRIVATEDRYFLCSLAQNTLTPPQWLHLVRSHWAVENNCHNTWDKIFREDQRPWIKAGEEAPSGVLSVMLLRRIAYNLLSLFRSVTQRSEARRQTPWRDLMRWLYNAIVAAQPQDVAGLRPRSLVAAASA